MGLKVLIAVDESQWAERAFKWYMKDLHKPGNEVILAHIGEPEIHGVKGLVTSQDEIKAIIAKTEARRERLKEKYGGELDSEKIPYKFISHESKEVGHELCRVAEEEGVKFCILGTRGMGLVRRTLLGSVRDYVVHHLQMPVGICCHE